MAHNPIDITTDIRSLTAFRRSSAAVMQQLKKSKRPMILTVNGEAAAVVQDAESYQRLLDIAARAETREGIRQGLQDARAGRTKSARTFFSEFEKANEL